MNRELNPSLSPAAGSAGGMFSRYTRSALSILFVLILGTMPAGASLGQSEASVTADQQHMKSEDHVQNLQAYKVHELTNAEGTIVREYLSPQGSVFGITWQGHSTPDMNQLLGTYVSNYQTATPAQTQIRHLRGITIKTSDFVYSNFCRLRMCKGSAYVPSLVPSNVPVEVMR